MGGRFVSTVSPGAESLGADFHANVQDADEVVVGV